VPSETLRLTAVPKPRAANSAAPAVPLNKVCASGKASHFLPCSATEPQAMIF
jgi:hypothetical protein